MINIEDTAEAECCPRYQYLLLCMLFQLSALIDPSAVSGETAVGGPV
jgi:hypothetical protein